jgi:putrescine transport system permease protein
MTIFSTVRLGLNPKINALASVLVAAVSVAALIAWWLGYSGEKRRQRDMQLAVRGDAAPAETSAGATTRSPKPA